MPEPYEYEIRIRVIASDPANLEHLVNDNLVPRIRGYLYAVVSARVVNLRDEWLDTRGDALDRDKE